MLKGLCFKIMLNKSRQGTSYSTCIIKALFMVWFGFCRWLFLRSLVFWIHFFLEEYFLHCKATSAAPQCTWLRKHLFPKKMGRTRNILLMHFYFQAMQYPSCFTSYYYLIHHLHPKQRLFSVQISMMVSRPLIFCWFGLGFYFKDKRYR